jgi:hypothetical protein
MREYGGKGLMCHNGDTIFRVSAVRAHLKQGDTPGPGP